MAATWSFKILMNDDHVEAEEVAILTMDMKIIAKFD